MPVNPLRFKDTAKLWMSSRRPQNNQSTNRDFYKILGVARGANAAEIKKGYRTKAKLLHPDANPGQDTTEQFQEVNRAYEVLTDPDLKTKYDRATATLIVRATSTAWYWRRAWEMKSTNAMSDVCTVSTYQAWSAYEWRMWKKENSDVDGVG
jgi:curved DNA-binding protein CbpA